MWEPCPSNIGGDMGVPLVHPNPRDFKRFSGRLRRKIGVYSRAAWWSSWHGSFNHDVALCIQKLNICIHTHTCIYLIYVKVSDDVSPQKGFRSKKRTNLFFRVQFPLPPISIRAVHLPNITMKVMGWYGFVWKCWVYSQWNSHKK